MKVVRVTLPNGIAVQCRTKGDWQRTAGRLYARALGTSRLRMVSCYAAGGSTWMVTYANRRDTFAPIMVRVET